MFSSKHRTKTLAEYVTHTTAAATGRLLHQLLTGYLVAEAGEIKRSLVSGYIHTPESQPLPTLRRAASAMKTQMIADRVFFTG